MMSDELSRKLGYSFNNANLLKIALTHRSSSDENNERMEFFGDAIVNLVIAEALFHQFPTAHEGDLSRFRATLVNRDTLGKLGREFELGRYLHLGMGELKSGGHDRTSIISCTMEAIIGAIYLDSDFNITRECILRWYQPLLMSLTNAASHKDPKTQLQEYLQSQHQALPVYTVESVEGELHQQIFVVSCTVLGEKCLARGSSRRRAEQQAAEDMLERLKK
ncbi:MAG TPA: ribonuclease III [Gammaproteobacteria bacterium]|nr:ribonuclease III [Gammaproteobacteria bacterium]